MVRVGQDRQPLSDDLPEQVGGKHIPLQEGRQVANIM